MLCLQLPSDQKSSKPELTRHARVPLRQEVARIEGLDTLEPVADALEFFHAIINILEILVNLRPRVRRRALRSLVVLCSNGD